MSSEDHPTVTPGHSTPVTVFENCIDSRAADFTTEDKIWTQECVCKRKSIVELKVCSLSTLVNKTWKIPYVNKAEYIWRHEGKVSKSCWLCELINLSIAQLYQLNTEQFDGLLLNITLIDWFIVWKSVSVFILIQHWFNLCAITYELIWNKSWMSYSVIDVIVFTVDKCAAVKLDIYSMGNYRDWLTFTPSLRWLYKLL